MEGLFRFGRRAFVSLLLARMFVLMLSKQVHLKAKKLSRKSTSMRDASTKFAKASEFIWSMCQYDLEVMRCSRQCLERLVSQGVAEVAIYGADDVAEVLYDLTFEVPVTVSAVYDDFPPKRFLTFEVLPTPACSAGATKVVVAALVGVDDKVERLMAAGTSGERIVVLPRPGIAGTKIAYVRDLAASADQSSSSSCESAL